VSANSLYYGKSAILENERDVIFFTNPSLSRIFSVKSCPRRINGLLSYRTCLRSRKIRSRIETYGTNRSKKLYIKYLFVQCRAKRTFLFGRCSSGSNREIIYDRSRGDAFRWQAPSLPRFLLDFLRKRAKLSTTEATEGNKGHEGRRKKEQRENDREREKDARDKEIRPESGAAALQQRSLLRGARTHAHAYASRCVCT